MNNKVWLSLFFSALLLDLVCLQFQLAEARFITKPSLVVFLIGYYLSTHKHQSAPLKVWTALALGFSWLGDVLLLFEYRANHFFILGLSAFLLAHLCYIYLFYLVKTKEGIPLKALLLWPVVFYYSALIGLLHPHLSAMKLPVYVYGLVICAMLFVALHLYPIRVNNTGRFILTGALLFVLSDTALAINKFYHPFGGAGIIIMLTYGLAQWCITEGCIRWMNTTAVKKDMPTLTIP